jgi:hypothetical protein
VSRLRRFLRIERPRAAGPDDADPSAETAERFEAVERPGAAPAAPRSSGAGLGRFGPEPEPSIDLVEADAADRPFTRCMRCGMDHNVFATQCTGCGASLDTAPQREFNDRLWAQRQEQAALDARAEAERRAAAARAEADLAASRRAMGEVLAREVGRQERQRLGASWGGGWDGLGSDSQYGYGGPPLGWRLLCKLPDWRWQVGAIAAALAVVGGLFAYGRQGHPGALVAAFFITIALVVPRWRMRDF